LTLALFTAARGVRAQPAPAAPRPNVVFILADDLGYGDLGCYGQKHIATPNIDKLATEGMRFTQFYAGNAVCAPSRCTLLTGLHSGHAFVRDNREVKPEGQVPLPAGTITVARLLKDVGYRTACIGKWGLGGPGSTGEPNKMGFDHFFGYLCQSKAHHFYPEYLWRNAGKVLFPENAGNRKGVYSHDLMTTEALEFVDKAKAGEPFFLYLAYTIPHFDLDVPDDSMKPYDGKWDEPKLPMGNYLPQDRPRAAYAGMISRMDRDIGRLMAALKAKGLDDNTLVIFTSDNGATFLKGLDSAFFNSCGPLRGFKGDLYEGGIRVPMIARWPGKVAAGAVNDAVGAFWDVMPTLVDLAGAPTPKNTDGVSLAPVLVGGGARPGRGHLYWEFPQKAGAQAVRIGNWKGVRQNVKKAPEGPIELYDLVADVGETKDVAAEHPDVVKRMAEIMRTDRTESAEFPLRQVAQSKPEPVR
jgi:arylsulfatase A-like enzyme